VSASSIDEWQPPVDMGRSLQHSRSLRTRMLDYPTMKIEHRPFSAQNDRRTGFGLSLIDCWRNAPCCPARSP
jgi:hypothetical protein